MPFRWTRTDAKGAFRLEGLDPRSPPAVCAWAPGFAPSLRRVAPDDVRAGPRLEASLDVRLVRGGSLIVHLAEVRSGRPVSGAVLDLEDARRGANLLDLIHRAVLGTSAGSTEDWTHASEHLLHESAEPGRYGIGPVEPGPYRLLVDRPGYRPERRNLTVLPPGEAVIGFRTDEVVPQVPGTLSLLVEMEPAR
jgi:hypothetical protein